MEFFARLEAPFLLGATAAYMAAMLLFWVQLFLWPQNPENTPRHTPASVGRIVLALGLVLHLIALAGQGPALFTVRAGVVGLFGWLLVSTYFVVGSRLGNGTAAIVSPVALCCALYSFAASQLHTWSPAGRLDSFWLASHVFVILAAYVALALAFAASLLYLVQDNLLKRKKLTGLWQKLPSLSVADEWIYRATTFGLALLTIGLFTGVAFNAVQHPGYVALRDPKVLFSVATWAIFALYLGARLKLGWHGRRSNLVVIYGFVVMVVSFFGVPHLVPQ